MTLLLSDKKIKKEGRQINQRSGRGVYKIRRQLPTLWSKWLYNSLPVLPVVQEVVKGEPSGGDRIKAVMKGWLRPGAWLGGAGGLGDCGYSGMGLVILQ